MKRIPTTFAPKRCLGPLDAVGRRRWLDTVGSLGKTLPAIAILLLITLLVPTGPFTSSVRADDGGDTTGLFPSLSLGRYGEDPIGLGQQNPAAVEASLFSLADHPQMVVVQVDVALESPWHIYSLTQPKGGPLPTKLKLAKDDVLQIVGDWQSDSKPKKSISQAFGGITVEEHEDEVKFFALAKIQKADQTPESLPNVEVEISALTCLSGGACQPLDETLTAKYAGPASPAMAEAALVGMDTHASSTADVVDGTEVSVVAEQVDASAIPLFQDDDYAIRWRMYVTPPTLHPGEQGKLVFTAVPEGEYHTYPGIVGDEPMSTNFAVEDKAGLQIAAPKTDAEIIKEELVPGLVNEYHPGDVTWTMLIEVPADAKPGKKTIRGAVGYQACTATSCLVPKALRFEAVVDVTPGDAPESSDGVQATAMTLTSAKFGDVKKLAGNTEWVDEIKPAAVVSDATNATVSTGDSEIDNESDGAAVAPIVMEDSSGASMTLPVLLGFALLGGFILNFMPCVLPVVGLKVMSFVQQAGSDRRRAFLLNFSYAAGIMAIFVLLAVLMVVFSMAWGEMFTHPEVRIALIVLMFAMALSYFGVWELPAPGMASSKGAQELQQREGYTGAFFKGMFATVLSTPCSGPFLGGIFALIGGKLPPLQSTIVILVVGLGMSVPYVIMGIWPKLMSWLPKPGPWMETFKEFLAFLFLATVAFFFYTFDDADKMWVFAALMGVWFGCWIIGKTPSWQTAQRRVIAWTSGIGVAVAISVLAFTYLGPSPPDQQEKQELIAWEPYDEARLQELHAEGKTVLVDFSAKWCLSCLVNLGVAIDTKPTADLVEELGVVTMYADWTDRSPEIKAKLDELQSKSIPLLAIYPGSDPSRPILLRDLVTQQNVLTALRQAGPSQAGPVVSHKPAEPKTLVTR